MLESRALPYTTLDISAPGAQVRPLILLPLAQSRPLLYKHVYFQHLREFMRARGARAEGQRHALPPQIFNGQQFRGVSSG